MSLTGGKKVKPRLVDKVRVPTAVIEPDKINWARRVAGIAKGVYGDVDKYIERERDSWDKKN